MTRSRTPRARLLARQAAAGRQRCWSIKAAAEGAGRRPAPTWRPLEAAGEEATGEEPTIDWSVELNDTRPRKIGPSLLPSLSAAGARRS
jgi:hypothetical protein